MLNRENGAKCGVKNLSGNSEGKRKREKRDDCVTSFPRGASDYWGLLFLSVDLISRGLIENEADKDGGSSLVVHETEKEEMAWILRCAKRIT